VYLEDPRDAPVPRLEVTALWAQEPANDRAIDEPGAKLRQDTQSFPPWHALFGLVGHGLRLRSPGYGFAGGLVLNLTVTLARVLAIAFPKAVPSGKEGRRKIEQGGVRLDGELVTDPDLELTSEELSGRTLQLGKRNWATLV
jgi:hypothetical protein